jgi:hypothetical protein
MKKIFIIALLISFMYGNTNGVTGTNASTTNSTNAGSETPTDGYTNKETGKTYKDENSISAEEKTKLSVPLQNLFKTTEWSLFLLEFEISWDIGVCGSGLDKAIGFKARMIEPLGYMETTKKPLYLPFADLDLGGSMIKSCTSRSASKDESARDECMYNHFIYAPIMGMIFKKKLKFVCFNEGEIALPVLSEFDPTHLKDVYNYKMIPHVIAMISPQAIVTSIINCGATMAYSMIKGYATNSIGDSEETFDSTSWANQYEDPSTRFTNFSSASTLKEKGLDGLGFIRNTMYYNLGCQGMHPVGGYVEGIDPGIDGSLLAYGALSKLHAASALTQIPLLKKQTEFSMELIKGVSDAKMPGSTLCKAKTFALPIETQYILQRAYPTVGSAKEFGETAATMTTLANVPGSKDSFVYVLWLRRDYYAFAYFCKDSFGTEYKAAN